MSLFISGNCEYLSGHKEHRGWTSFPWTQMLLHGAMRCLLQSQRLVTAISSSCCKKPSWKHTAHPTWAPRGPVKHTEQVKAAEWRVSPALSTSHILPKPRVTWVMGGTTNLASLPCHHSQPSDNGAFSSQAYFSLIQSVNECSSLCSW